jgi:hypothetical protein
MPLATVALTEIFVPLGPVDIALSNLQAKGQGQAPGQIIKSSEAFDLSIDVEFQPNPSPFVDFLMSVGLTLEVTFVIEGYGTATEKSLGPVSIKTTDSVYKYTPTLNAASPATEGVTPGYYKLAALLTIKGGAIPLAVGSIGEVVFQVYA